MAKIMLCENNLPKYFLGEAINTACYVINRVTIRSLLSKTPYKLYKGRKPNVSCHNGFPPDLDDHKNKMESPLIFSVRV